MVDSKHLNLFGSADNTRVRNVPDYLPDSSDMQNIFLPVSTNIQLEQYYFYIILCSLFKTQLHGAVQSLMIY